jgi:hypothetical protein
MDRLAHGLVLTSVAIAVCGMRAPPPCRAALLWAGLVSALYWRSPVQTAGVSAWLALDIASAVLAVALVLRHACLPARTWPWIAAGVGLNATSWVLGWHGPTPTQRAAHLGFHVCAVACLAGVSYGGAGA